jgi:hypothetical protein
MRARVALVALLALAGCDGDGGGGVDHACTEIGCSPDSVQVEVQGVPNGNFEVALCVENRKCVRQRRSGEPLQLLGGSIPKGRNDVRVTMVVRKNGRVIARATRRFPVRVSRPNGPDCPPVCRQVNVRFDVPSNTLEEA